jgi:hypothetical protein
MKKWLFIPAVLLATSCDIIIDPSYDWRDRVTGTYEVQEYSESHRMTTTYRMTITKGYGSTVYLNNFYGAGLSVAGSYNGNQIEIWQQYQNGYEIEGVATVTGSEIRMTYSVRNVFSRSADFCNSVAWRW